MKPKLTHSKCIELLKEQDTPRNIFLHSRKVNAISNLLADKLSKAGIKIDKYLVDTGSLLHDIKKWHCLKSENCSKGYHERHHYAAYNTLILMGYPFQARIALKHGLDEVLCKKYGLTKWEDIIVYYADKRVNHDKVVTLDGRFEYLRKRYGSLSKGSMENINRTERPLKELEEKIFKRLDIKPGDITEESIKPFLIAEAY